MIAVKHQLIQLIDEDSLQKIKLKKQLITYYKYLMEFKHHLELLYFLTFNSFFFINIFLIKFITINKFNNILIIYFN
ncbi:hypothetical protein XBJ2_1880016 [Xenorhabdus bovienii str. Jollieti]|nr:hypothetical protein XBJ2_1880016 [Xenorhabdus bovienii str. Jollieti]